MCVEGSVWGGVCVCVWGGGSVCVWGECVCVGGECVCVCVYKCERRREGVRCDVVLAVLV